jgi:signal transduction histidine kinase
MFFAAAAAFAVKASRSDDRFVGLFAVACVLGGFARVNYALVPSLYTNQVFSGDAFRLVSCGVLMSAAFIEIVAYWRIRAIAAALEERRRLAYDLHDGLAQELAFIVSEASRPDAEPGSLAAAAERALFEARQAIAALTISEDEPFAAALERVVREVPRRDRVAMSVGRISVEPPRAVRDDLLRIAREAILNAVKHAHADEIWVELTDVPLTLRVVDDGVGFDPGAPLDGDHFGIASMRTRSARIGATLSFLHGTAGGTTVEVALP